MTTDNSFPAPPQAPPDVSALVVGLESYGFPESEAALPGSARSAARFASWLIRHGVCRPERITLMTTYDQAAYASQTYHASLSPVDKLRELGNNTASKGIDLLYHAKADLDFTDWINGDRGPRKKDRLFLLFWVGHGYAYPHDPHERLALLGSDADTYKLRHVELKDLLHAVGGVAADADVVAFVNACRAPVQGGWARRLEGGFQPITTQQDGESRRTRNQSIVYAAAHGQTTKMAGPEETTFAEEVLRRLEALPSGDGPLALFGEELERLVEELHQDQVGPYWTTYGYRDSNGDRQLPPPPDDLNLTHEEWQNLVEAACAIDAAHDIELTEQVRWGAYCHAVGPVMRDSSPQHLNSVKELIVALRHLSPRRRNWAPPLVIACDFLAHLPRPGSQPGLAAWCADWADDRGGDGLQLLELAEHYRPTRLQDRACLVITVDEGNPLLTGRRHPARRFYLMPVLWAIGGPDPLGKRGPFSRNQIPAQAAAAIREAINRGTVPDPAALLVEFIVPKKLRGWRFEHEESEFLGLQYAIAIRALELVRDAEGEAAKRVKRKNRLIADFRPGESSPWSERIEWFTCEEPREPTREEIVISAQDDDKFCIALGRKENLGSARRDNGRVSYNGRNGSGNDSPAGLDDSIEKGAAIVLSMRDAKGCHSCAWASQPSDGNERMCHMPIGKRLISQKVDESPAGLRDLPYILRDIRKELVRAKRTGLEIGVYMEDVSRLWLEDDRLQIQFRADK